MMRTIKQEDQWGCGIACLAMLGGTSYKKAKDFMLDRHPKVERTRKVSSGKILDGLEYFGLESVGRRCRAMNGLTVDDLPRDALVGVRLDRKRDGATHWVVWDHKKQKVRDPWPEKQKVYPVKYLLVGEA